MFENAIKMINLLLTKRLLLLLGDISRVDPLQTSIIALMVGIACVGTIMIYFSRHVTSFSHRSNKESLWPQPEQAKKKRNSL